MSNFWDSLRGLFTPDGNTSRTQQLIAQSEDYDGFTREDAVRQLGRLADPIALIPLLRRANDWVPQVRVAALEALRSLMIPANATAFVQHLPAIFHLEKCRRASHSAFLQDCLQYLCKSENSAIVIAGLNATDVRVRRLCVKVAFTQDIMPPNELVRRAITDPDQAIQQIGASQLFSLGIGEASLVIKDAITSRSASVRRAAFHIYSTTADVNSTLAMAQKFSVDDSSMVRESALAWLLEKRIDVGEMYMDILDQPAITANRLRAVILGISEANLKRYTERVIEYWPSLFPAVRRATLISVVRLDPGRGQSICQDALADVSPSVVLTAYRLLAKLGVRFDAAQLFDLASGERQNITIRGATNLARYSNKWERLIFLLRVANSKAPTFNFKSELANWQREFNRSWAAPTPGQLNTLKVLIENQLHFLSVAERDQLSFVLSHAPTK